MDKAKMKKRVILISLIMIAFTGISYVKEPKDDAWKMIGMLGVAAGFLVLYDYHNYEKNIKRKHLEFFRQSYPMIAANVSLLLQSGMSPKGAFLYLAKEYEKEDLLQNELRILQNKLNAGYGEKLAYKEFGENCMTSEYSRLMSLLIQYLEQGTKQISVLLELEMREAYNMRLRMTRQRGEEMSTKMLLPMGLLLLDVIAIVVAPIMMSIQSLQTI